MTYHNWTSIQNNKKNLEHFPFLILWTIRVSKWLFKTTFSNFPRKSTIPREMLEASIWHNFVPRLATWQVVIGKDVLVDRVGTHPYQLQLTMWRIVAQNYAKISIPSISYNSTVHVLLFWLQFHLENYIIRNTSLGKGLHRDWEFSWHAYVKIFLGSELPNCLPQLLSTLLVLSSILPLFSMWYALLAVKN